MDMDMGDALPWLTLVLAFVGAVLGGIGTEWYSQRQQRQRARDDRQRQALSDVRRTLQHQWLQAWLIHVTALDAFSRTGAWRLAGLKIPEIPGITDVRDLTFATHQADLVVNDELRRLVREFSEAVGTVAMLATTAEESARALAGASEINQRAQSLITRLLDNIP